MGMNERKRLDKINQSCADIKTAKNITRKSWKANEGFLGASSVCKRFEKFHGRVSINNIFKVF